MSEPIHPTRRPPESWAPAQRIVQRVVDPVQRFLALDAAGGILLLLATLVALGWANSPWQASYHALWHVDAGIHLGSLSFARPLHFWVNDGLMTIFFFVVGLEIRRELHDGSLSVPRQALLPLVAAVGGMLVPAALYTALNVGHSSASGWGVPMATDIAFSLGLLALLGARVPPALRIILLALAVIDDIGAILVIAIFYSTSIVPWGFAVAGVGLAAIFALQGAGVRQTMLYVPPGLIVWAGFLIAGIHPTLAGVLVGLVTPVRAWFGADGFMTVAEQNLELVREQRRLPGQDRPDLAAPLDQLAIARREAVSPVQRLLGQLHGWVAYAIMPLFAFANAGVTLGGADWSGTGVRVLAGVTLGLVVGKPLGVVGASALACRIGWTALPGGVSWRALWVIGLVAGVGFTMSLFIAQLAFAGAALLDTAKLAVMVASTGSAVLTLLFGRFMLGDRSASS